MGERVKWTVEAIQILRDKYTTTPIEQLAAELGRSIISVQLKASRIGISQRRNIIDIDKFFTKFAISDREFNGTPCWEWARKKNRDGYGRFIYNHKTVMAHRFAYEYFVGSIASDKEMDHLCRNRGCVNPMHLEQVTQRINALRGISPMAINARKTHCLRGHEFDKQNCRVNKYGHRHCRMCHRLRMRVYNRKINKT
jgi:hypothetical protein